MEEYPPENLVFEAAEAYCDPIDMYSTEWDYSAYEYWNGEETDDED